MLASLHGKRLAVSSEIEESAHWAEARIKSMTGDETMTARYMRQDFFTFRVSHKHVIAGNFKPRLKGDDFAMVRRMVLVPFSQRFEGARRDNNLPEKLKAEYPGIMAWFIEGARKWAASGLAIPAAITEASQEYMAEQDDIGLWVASCCEKVKGARELATALFTSFEAWKRSNGEHAGSGKTFSQRLERIYDKKRVTKGMEFIGLRLVNPFEDQRTENPYEVASRGE
jgi:putative DNA primase/helicase